MLQPRDAFAQYLSEQLALREAILKHDIKKAELLITTYKLDVNYCVDGWIPHLYEAINQDDVTMMDLLIKSGANRQLNWKYSDAMRPWPIREEQEFSPLTFAVSYNKLKATKRLLLESDINVNFAQKLLDHVSITTDFLVNTAFRLLITASKYSSEVYLLVLNSPKFDPNVRNSLNESFLEFLAKRGELYYIKALQGRPDVDINIDNGAPLKVAAAEQATFKDSWDCKRRDAIMSLLIKSGAE